MKIPGGKRKLGRFRELQAVYVVGMTNCKQFMWARNMTDEVKTFVETTSQRVLDQAKEHRLFPSPVRTS